MQIEYQLPLVVKLNADILKLNLCAVAITICVCLIRGRRLGPHRLVTRSRINGGLGLLDIKLQGELKVLPVTSLLETVCSVGSNLMMNLLSASSGAISKINDHVNPADIPRDMPTI